MERKSGSSSRSPSLSRRPSLKEKKPGIEKKKKPGRVPKKERWLLTRKTWRYMTDAVGNLLPEKSPAYSASLSGFSSRRGSTDPHVTPPPSSFIHHGHAALVGTPTSPPPKISGGVQRSGPPAGLPGYHIVYGQSFVPVPRADGPGERRVSSDPPSSSFSFSPERKVEDVPSLERRFDHVCTKEKSFILWTRTGPKLPSGPALREKKTEAKDRLLEYYSAEDDLDDDAYDEYEQDEEQLTVLERRKSSTASSVLSIVGPGSFFSPPFPSVSSDSFSSLQRGPVEILVRNSGVQTDPFPEEILTKLRLQSVEEEQQKKEEDAPRGSISSSSGMSGKEGSLAAGEDKKSEESGYSSSISDTVMRYLRMVRKNSKADNKETIDKFKTVNYDRSLRYIKSKNVTIEEALEHEKNKALAAKAQEEAAKNPPPKPLPSVGVQAGESLVRFLKNLHPGRNFPDFSSAHSFSSDSPAETTSSPRYSIATTALSSNSDDLFQQLRPRRSFDSFPDPDFDDVFVPFQGTPRRPKEILHHFDYPEKTPDPPPGRSAYTRLSPSRPPPSYPLTSPTFNSPPGGSKSLIRLPPVPGFSISRPVGGSAGTLDSEGTFPTLRNPSQVDLRPSRNSVQSRISPVSSSAFIRVSSAPTGICSSGDFEPSTSSANLSRSQSKSRSLFSSNPFSSSKLKKSLSASSAAPLEMGGKCSLGSFGTTRGSGGNSGGSGEKSTGIPGGSGTKSGGNKSGGIGGGNKSGLNVGGPVDLIGDGSNTGGTIGGLISGGSGGVGSGGGESVGGSGGGSSGGSGCYGSPQPSSSFFSRRESVKVMQKSKSSSSVLNQYGSGKEPSRLISRPKLFKSRSKSQTRSAADPPTKPQSSWTPLGKCQWANVVSGRQVTLEPESIVGMCEEEWETLQKVAVTRLTSINLGVPIKIPKEKEEVGVGKTKRRPYLLKKKALSTGFFDSTKREEKGRGEDGSCLVFGIPLSKCVANDRKGKTRISFNLQEGDSQHKICHNGSRFSSATADTKERNVPKLWYIIWMPNSRERSPERLYGSIWERSWSVPVRGSFTALDEISLTSDVQPEGGWSGGDGNFHVPAVVIACTQHLEAFGLHTTGIFRVSTSMKRIRQLREELDSGKAVELGKDQSPHDVAALLKDFLRDLPDTLLSRDLYPAIINAQRIRNRQLQFEAFQNLILLLPIENRDTLGFLLRFFSKVADNAKDFRTKSGTLVQGNKMENYNLATLLAPNILPCLPTDGKADLAELAEERRDAIDIVSFLISQWRELLTLAPETLDDLYTLMLDKFPDVVDRIFTAKFGPEEIALDDAESTSSVFEGSECGEQPEIEIEPQMSRLFRKREDLLHEGGGKGGRRDPETRGRRDESKERGSDVEKQSGGDSDSSSTKSTSRWFRRSRGSDQKNRTSSDSGGGSEKRKGSKKKDGSLAEGKRATSLDSVNLRESIEIRSSKPLGGVLVTSDVQCTPDKGLKIPDNLSRRQSSPVIDGGGVITASLKIPVPLAIDDSDIPFIEEENGEGQVHHQTFSLASSQQAAAAYAAKTRRSASSEAARAGSLQGPTSSSGRHLSDHSNPNSPPSSPPYNPTAFPYEEMTARICLGNPPTSSKGNTITATTTISSVREADLTPAPYFLSSGETKGGGKETKGANIAGLIKSKTADFEKLSAAKSRLSPSTSSASSSTGIAPKMRLRSQENIQLKQQFLLRQQQAEKVIPRSPEAQLTSPASSAYQRAIPRRSPSGPVSRWKRSEIIASQTGDSPPKEPETFV